MRLTDPTLLRLAIVREGTSARALAKAIGKHHSFIDHLVSGRRQGCLPDTAAAIAASLHLPVAELFEDEEATA